MNSGQICYDPIIFLAVFSFCYKETKQFGELLNNVRAI